MANDRQKAKEMAAKGKSVEQIKAKTGVGSATANKYIAKFSPSPAPAPNASAPQPAAPQSAAPQPRPAAQTSQSSINKNNSVGQNLRVAASNNGVLSEGELLKISKATGKSNEKVLEKAVDKGLMIGSKVTNRYQKGKYTDPRLAMVRMALPEFAMATGKDNPILQQLRNAGKQDRGSALFIGSKGSTATTLPKRMGAGNMQQPTPTTTPLPTDPGSTDPGTSTPVDTTPTMIPEQLPEDPAMAGPGMMSGGGLGALGANKLNRAKSRLRQLGIYGRGTGLLGRGLQYGNALNK